MLRVSGKRIVGMPYDTLRGFNLWHGNVFETDGFRLTAEEFQKIKDWGFNVVVPEIWWTARWGGIEQDFNQPGVYTEASLLKLDACIQRAGQAGLYVIPSPRVSILAGMPPAGHWQGWGWHDYLLTPEGLARYCNFLKMMVQRYNGYNQVIGYCPWHFPWHGDWTYPPDKMSAYYNTITPAMINAVRAYSDKIIFYSPFCHGIGVIAGEHVDTGQFATLSPVADDNVVYCHDGHRPLNVEEECASWDYDEAYIRHQYEYAMDFADAHNVPLCLAEFGMLIHGPCAARPINQSRLDCLDAKLKILDELGNYNWLYWIYGPPEGSNLPQGVLENNLSPSAVVPVLQAHAPKALPIPRIIRSVGPFIFGTALIGLAEGVK